MNIFVKKTLSGLIPASRTEFDKLQEAKLKLNECYEVEIKKPRNIGFHRKFFALLNIGYENQDKYSTFEQFRIVVIIEAGYFIEVVGKEVYRIPKSISFAKMDQLEFEKLYSAVIDVIIKMLGCEKEDLLQAVVDFI